MRFYDPFAKRTASPAPFSFAIPNEALSRRDTRAIRRSAIRERARYLKLQPGELSPVQRRYQAACNSGRLEVLMQRVAYAKAVGDTLVSAQRDATLAAVDPPGRPAPPADAPAGGIDRNLWLSEVRRNAAYEAERERRRNMAAAAEATLSSCELDIEAIDHLAAVALEAWVRFAQTLFELHADYLVGANNVNPTMVQVRFTALQAPAALEPLDLWPRRPPEPAGELGAG